MSYGGKEVLTTEVVAVSSLNDNRAGLGTINKAISLTGGIPAANGLLAGGILLEGADVGGHVTLGVMGTLKFTAGAAVAAGKRLTVTLSGYCIEAASGSYVVGNNLYTAVASDAVGAGIFNFATKAYMGDSGESA